MELVHDLEKIAKKKGCTTGQVGIAWVKAQSGKKDMPTIIPIPGATTAERVEENMVDVSLDKEDLDEINSILKSTVVHGGRYGGHGAALEFGNSPPLKE